MTERGQFFGIAIWHPKSEANVGTLWRTAHTYGAAFIATIGARYKRQHSDTSNVARSIPMFHHDDFDGLRRHLPHDSMLVGVEMTPEATPLPEFQHPPRAVYLLGAEDHGLSATMIAACHKLVVVPADESLNVAVAGSIVLYDRITSGRTGWA